MSKSGGDARPCPKCASLRGDCGHCPGCGGDTVHEYTKDRRGEYVCDPSKVREAPREHRTWEDALRQTDATPAEKKRGKS